MSLHAKVTNVNSCILGGTLTVRNEGNERRFRSDENFLTITWAAFHNTSDHEVEAV